MNQIKYIKEQVNDKGISINSVHKDTGISWRTVNKYAEMDDMNIYPERKIKRECRLDKYKPTIDKILIEDKKAPKKQRHTAKRIHERLKELFPNDYDMSDRTIRTYVAKAKAEIYKDKVEGYLPLEHAPGEAQVDFGKVTFIENGQTINGSALTISYPNSNAGFTQLCKGENVECLLTSMKNIFEYVGVVPTEIWFDNMSTAVKTIKKGHSRELTDSFERFALHYGFNHNFCNPARGNEKGSVENKVGYTRRNLFVPVPEFKNLYEYNKEVLKRCEDDFNRIHYSKHISISNLFKQDIEASKPLPRIPYDVYRILRCKTNKYAKIKIDSKYTYSTSPAYAEREVWVKLTDIDVIILNDDYKEIIRHTRLYGDLVLESMEWVTYIDLMSRKPFALKYTKFYSNMPYDLQLYFDKCTHKEKKEGLRALSTMLSNIDINEAANVFMEAEQANCKDSDSLIAIYHKVVNGVLEMDDIELSDTVPQVCGYEANLSIYDNLLGGSSFEKSNC